MRKLFILATILLILYIAFDFGCRVVSTVHDLNFDRTMLIDEIN